MQSDPEEPRPVQLEYAAAPSQWRGRIRRALLGLCLLGVALVGWRWGPVAWTRAQVLYWQGKCSAHAPPAGMVVFEEDPIEAGKLLALPGYALAQIERIGGGFGSTTAPSVGVAAYSPEYLEHFLQAAGLSLYPPQIVRADGRILIARRTHHAIAFLGALKTPSGQKRLVVITANIQMKAGQRSGGSVYFSGASFDPASALKPATVIDPIQGGMSPPGLQGNIWGRPAAARIFAGQVDPSDPSRFTIRYESTGPDGTVKGRLDGRLTDQGYIELKSSVEQGRETNGER